MIRITVDASDLASPVVTLRMGRHTVVSIGGIATTSVTSEEAHAISEAWYYLAEAASQPVAS